MIIERTFFLYFSKLFAKYFVVTSFVISCLLLVTNIFDVLQNFRSVDISMGNFWRLISFKIPYLFNEIAIILSFISTLLFLLSLAKNNELVVILSNGVPIWKVFIVPVIGSFLIGVFIVAFIQPIGTYGLREYERIESRVKDVSYMKFVVSKSGIFFFEKIEDGNRIIQASSIHIPEKSLNNVTILFLDINNNLIKRIDSKKVILNEGKLKISSPVIIENDISNQLNYLEMETKLSTDNLINRFISPEKILLWKLAESIEKFESSGFSVTKYQLYYYKQLFKPIAMMAMSFVACWFIILNIKGNIGPKNGAFSIIVGISSYAFLEFAFRILAYSGLSIMLATLLPILFIILISNFVILHLQEA